MPGPYLPGFEPTKAPEREDRLIDRTNRPEGDPDAYCPICGCYQTEADMFSCSACGGDESWLEDQEDDDFFDASES